MTVAGGVWDQDRAAGAVGYWAGGVSTLSPITGPIIHGYSEIQVVAFSDAATEYGQQNDQNVVALYRQSGAEATRYFFLDYYMEGSMDFYANGVKTIAVDNTDGAYHKYGWEIDQSTRMVKMFFDDVQVGEEDGYNIAIAALDTDGVYIGDATGGGAHHSYWDRFVIGEGLYPGTHIPEPSSIMLLGLGVVGLLCYAWRKRK